MRFEGKSAIVSGAAGDVGRLPCRAPAHEGAHVVGIDIAATAAPRARVNAICPGPLDTAMPRRFLQGHPQAEEIMRSMGEATMLKRLGEAQEIVQLCLFLASAESGFITGAAMTIDGGMSA
jgi:NAD(P)-dependent dehydrogenase (short-subunit alcohol dehydrogenase family)